MVECLHGERRIRTVWRFDLSMFGMGNVKGFENGNRSAAKGDRDSSRISTVLPPRSRKSVGS